MKILNEHLKNFHSYKFDHVTLQFTEFIHYTFIEWKALNENYE